MEDDFLDFITPSTLRSNIKESLSYVGFLYTLSETIDTVYKDETIRTIVLYNSAVVEALLLFRAKKRKIKFPEEKFTYTHSIPKIFQQDKKNIILALHTTTEKPENRVWFRDLVREQKDFLGKKLSQNIIEMYDIRNTFHLSKKRSGLDSKKVESSSKLVLDVIKKLHREFVT